MFRFNFRLVERIHALINAFSFYIKTIACVFVKKQKLQYMHAHLAISITIKLTIYADQKVLCGKSFTHVSRAITLMRETKSK